MMGGKLSIAPSSTHVSYNKSAAQKCFFPDRGCRYTAETYTRRAYPSGKKEVDTTLDLHPQIVHTLIDVIERARVFGPCIR